MIIADTDVLIDFLHGKGAADRIALEIEHGALCTSSVSRFELLAGARDQRQQVLIDQLLRAVPALPLDAGAADLAAQVHRILARQGRSIGLGDSLIAGIVLSNDAILLTRNRDRFERVPGLHLGTMSD